MIRSRLFWKLFGGFAAIILLTAGITVVLLGRRAEQYALAETEDALRAKAYLLHDVAAPWFGRQRDPELQRQVEDLGRRTQTRLTVIRVRGTVIADSQEHPSRMDNHADRPEIMAARDSGIGSAVRAGDTVHERMMYFALAVRSGDRLLGYVRTAVSLRQLDEQIDRLRWTAIAAAAVGVPAALLLGVLLARRITRPVESLTAAAQSVADGSYAQRIHTRSSDEVGRLAEAFNRMAEQLSARMDTLTHERNQVLAVLRSMVEGVVAVDRGENVVHMNEPAGAILRVRPAECLRRPVWEAVRVREVGEALAEAVRGRAEVVRELRLTDTPRDRVVQLRASPLRDGSDQPTGAVVVLHDLTELRRLEEIRRDFVANVSHELKTPITAIRGLVETVRDDPQMDAATRTRFLAKVADQSTRLSSLVGDLLTLSRVESQDSGLERGPVDLRAPAADSLRRLAPLGRDKGLAIAAEVPETAATVAGDAEALREVVDNLLDNAIKYTPAGGRVWVRIRREGPDAVLEVQDTGIGIEPRDQERVFERFYRVDKARSRELGGTGLGLSIVKHIVLAHGGTVSVESTPGRGSTFRVRLPAAAPAGADPG
jgi:two-component system phosphate regulon sensor histidine kinase PhoR